ncbi:MAG: carboxypeptidase-like regulatory domain-containing protein [Chitinophagaceae bacterium]
MTAQDNPATGIGTIVQALKKNTDRLPVEKIHLHLNKPWYSIGDTLWFKAYLLDAAYLAQSTQSGLIYVEIADDSNHLVKRILIPAAAGLSWGNVALTEKLFSSGAYTIRAYTKWMLNFGETHIFKKKFYVSDAVKQAWLVSLRQNVLKEDGKQKAVLDLIVKTSFNTGLSSKPLLLKVTERGRVTDRDAVTTGAVGDLSIRFSLPERSLKGKLALSLENQQKNEPKQKLVIPLLFDRPEFTDLQFMPESGNLVNGLRSKIAFKAIGEDGKGKEISGVIVSQSGQQVTHFQSSHKGMGYFLLLPASGEKYTAVVTLPDGTKKSYPLPLAENTGTLLTVTNEQFSDSIIVNVSSSLDLIETRAHYYLLGQSRGFVCWGASFSLNRSGARLAVSKKLFPTGISRFSLLTSGYRPLNERIIYVDGKDELKIALATSKPEYNKRDSAVVDFQVTDELGKPVVASLSIAITDDNQVIAAARKNGSIITDLLLSSDLKGFVEEPGYYLENDSSGKSWGDLDNLLLTQGWTVYDWTAILSETTKIKFAPEKEYLVQGTVTNLFNKPVKNTSVVLFSRNPVVIMDTRTNDAGTFIFNDFPTSDTTSFLLQARNKNGRSFNVGIEIDEFKPPVISNTNEISLPWYVNIDTSGLKVLTRGMALREDKFNLTGQTKMLEEVFVIGKKVIKDSKNLYGPGESDFAMNAEDLGKAGKATLRELLEKNITGFHIGFKKKKGGMPEQTWQVNTSDFHLIIDGISVDYFISEGMSRFEYYKNFLDYYTAEDIKGIELMRTGKYQMGYTTRYIDDPFAVFYNHVFVEVTTYSGHGPFMKKLPGIFLYKPLPLTLPSRFYAPKYVGNSSIDPIAGTDIRSTIHWEPNLVTDKDGRAKLSFFTADYPGTYTLIVEGADMNGGIGESRKTIRIK